MTSYAEWKNFVNKCEVDSPNLDIEILKAWARSQKIGVNPLAKLSQINRHCKSFSSEGKYLVDLLDKYKTIISTTAKSLAALVIVSDAEGIILKVIVDAEILNQAARIYLKPNADWSEKNAGNNFIGSAVATGHESVVEGCSHYCILFHDLSGIGIPVFASDNLVGVIGIAVLDNITLSDSIKEFGRELGKLLSAELQKETTDNNPKRESLSRNRKTTSTVSYDFSDLVGKSAVIKEALGLAKMAAKSDLPVLILGESGTGKEMVAQAIHNNSHRKNGLFIAINCGAFPRELINSELFGYVEGAFTGAKKGGYIGKFEAANKGTLFLDEIGDMPLELQVTLLRVLQEKKITKIGDYQPIPVDVRIITATNKDLVSEISWAGTFRSDLYYRLNALTIMLPPLRERQEDIPELAMYFLEEIKKLHNDKRVATVDEDVINLFMNYSWLGNVRELKNVIERAYYFAEGKDAILKEHLPRQFQTLKNRLPTGNYTQTIDQAERDTIIKALEQNHWNIKQTAETLGIARSTLYRKIDNYKIEFTVRT